MGPPIRFISCAKVARAIPFDDTQTITSLFHIHSLIYGQTYFSISYDRNKKWSYNDMKHHRVNGGDILLLTVFVALVDTYKIVGNEGRLG